MFYYIRKNYQFENSSILKFFFESLKYRKKKAETKKKFVYLISKLKKNYHRLLQHCWSIFISLISFFVNFQ